MLLMEDEQLVCFLTPFGSLNAQLLVSICILFFPRMFFT